MNKSSIVFKNSKNNDFNKSIISSTKIKKNKRESLNSSFIFDQPVIHNGFGEDKTLSKAYKNVMNVITNILGKIESQKINGITNNLNINANSQRKRENEFLKFPNKINVLETPKSMKSIQKALKKIDSKEMFSLSNISKKSLYTIKSSSNIINNKGFKIPKIKIIKPDNEEKPKKKLFNKSYNINKINEINNSIRSTNQIRSNFPKFNDLLNINKKRMIRPHSNKIISQKLIKNSINAKKDSSKKNLLLFNEDDNNTFSSLSIIPLKSAKKIMKKTLSKNDKSLNLKIKDKNKKLSRREGKSKNINKSKNIKRATINFSPQTKMQIEKKLQLHNIHKKLYDYENNEITDAINKLPEENKRQYNKRRKNVILTQELKDIVSLNPDLKSLLKHFEIKNKEKYYRCLLFKGNVYDSLNDDESEEEIDEYFCYFEPNSKFLYVLDSIMFISSLIILIYLPFFLAKNLYFCQNFYDINTIIFYLIDIF